MATLTKSRGTQTGLVKAWYFDLVPDCRWAVADGDDFGPGSSGENGDGVVGEARAGIGVERIGLGNGGRLQGDFALGDAPDVCQGQSTCTNSR